jgi:hypothetical protein
MNKLRQESPEFQARKGRGRPPGALNKATKTFRETVSRLLEDNAENVSKWLTEVAEGSVEKELKADPKAALTLLAQMAEYATPKLARTEVTGKDGGALEFSDLSDSELDKKIKAAMSALNV